MSTPQQRIRDFYGFDFPEDFFRFCEFMRELPPGVLGETTDMAPAFPFDVADGTPARDHPDHPHWEDRWYHDLPEFITLFTGSIDGLHWGYFFDDPGKMPPIVPFYWHSDTFEHAVGGNSIFEAFRDRLECDEAEFAKMKEDDPGSADDYQRRLEQLATAREVLTRFGEGFETQESRLATNPNYAGPVRKAIAPTWSRLGIVVRPEQYWRLPADPFAQAGMGGRMVLKQEEVTNAISQATLLCKMGYPGTALKLGHDLWVWASEYPQVYELLDLAYQALGREILRGRLTEARAYRKWCDERRH